MGEFEGVIEELKGLGFDGRYDHDVHDEDATAKGRRAVRNHLLENRLGAMLCEYGVCPVRQYEDAADADCLEAVVAGECAPAVEYECEKCQRRNRCDDAFHKEYPEGFFAPKGHCEPVYAG